MLPGVNSVAIDAGNPNDMSPAQNGLIGDSRRDVGAAERNALSNITNSSIEGLNVYPNPNYGSFSIDLGKVYYKIKVTITDIAGKKIYSNTFLKKQIVDISMQEVPVGIYFVNIRAEKNTAIVKVVKK